MTDCEHCDNSFPTEHGLKIHMGHKHSEDYRVEVPCGGDCGKTKAYSPATARQRNVFFCSDACKKRWWKQNMAGEQHTNWSDEGNTTCDNCAKAMHKPPNQVERSEHHFCSTKCYWEHRKTLTGEKNAAWKGDTLNTSCAECGDTFRVLAESELKEKNFCSSDCYGSWLSKNSVGEQNKNWRGGHARYYGPDWIRQRRKAFQRDNGTCQNCGVTDSILDVHHIIPFKEFEDHTAANRIDNLITLCRSCHASAENQLRNTVEVSA